DLAGYPALRDLHGGFDHREGEAFDAEAVVIQIPALDCQKTLRQGPCFGMIRQQLREALLRQAKELLILPERVVRVESDGGDHSAPSHMSCRQLRDHAGLRKDQETRPLRRSLAMMSRPAATIRP